MGTIPYVPSYLRASPSLIWPVTSVLDFGAIGNGSTDDYPAITAALHALNARGGGTLVFPNDRDFRIATPGVHGIHLEGRSNITILMGERSRLIMDNMVDGLAVSHGIFVEGPAENISLIGVHVTFATLSVTRQTWAPIYFLGANVGNGDASLAPALGWYRGNPDGSEAWQQIEAGAVRNVRLENVTSENSPSVGIGVVGVDGLRGNNITVRKTRADGLYHVYFRNSRIDGYHGIEVGDDGLSIASYESDLEAADIELPFHGEGSTFSNIVLEGRTGDAPAGSIVPLGVRDVVIDGVVVVDRFRGLKFEPGTQKTLDYPSLSLNFLANRRVTIGNLTFSGLTQDISGLTKECNTGTPEKWWMQDVLVCNVVGENGSSPFDVASTGIPQNGNPSVPLLAGITFRNLKFRNYSSPYTTLAGFIGCTFDGLDTDSFIAIQGSVPYGQDPDGLDGDGNPLWRDNLSTFRGVKGSAIIFQGIKRCQLDGIESLNAPTRAVTISSSADVHFGTVRVLFPNRLDDPLDNGALGIDEYCKRITGELVQVETDDHGVHSAALLNTSDHWIERVELTTTQDATGGMESDRAWIEDKVSQIGEIASLHTGSSNGWQVRRFPKPPAVGVRGDADADLFVGTQGGHQRLVFPLSADRTWILHEGGAAIGDRIEVTREAAATGPHSIVFQGQSAAIVGFDPSDATTQFLVAGGASGQVTSIEVDESVELLGAPVSWATSNEATATAIVGAINAFTGTSGFTAIGYGALVRIIAPDGSGLAYNNARVVATTAGDISLSVGVIPPMTGGSDAGSAGERVAASSFLLIGDEPEGFSGAVTSITVDGTELLGEPVAWTQNSNVFASLIAGKAMESYGTHGFTVYGIRNSVYIKAPPGNGASANGWAVVVTPTGDVTTYDVTPLSGGLDAPVATPAGAPYDIVTTTPGEAFNATFEFAVDGWKLVSIVYLRLAYPNGVPLIDGDGRLYGQGGAVIADEFDQLKYADGSVLAYTDTLGFGSGPAPASTDPGVPRMARADANFIYVCTAPDTWKRVALSSF
jgi:hypothetical protein